MSIFGFTDEPKQRREDDQFEVARYITGLRKFIQHCGTPMTIAIQGDWGSGKTSIMNMVMDELSDSIIPVWFNTWQYSQFDMGDKLPLSLLSNLVSMLAPNVGTDQVKAVVTTLTSILVDKVAGSRASEGFDQFISGGDGSGAQAVGKLKEQFQVCIKNACEKRGKDRVVIFVDDLDRLQPARAVELLEVLKLFLDCRSCVFVLAIDYEVVSKGIEQKFGLADREKSRSFFDKIIQVPFKMPVAQYNLDGYIAQMLSELHIEVTDQKRSAYLELIRRSVGCNPRSMKRLFNVFSLLDCIQEGAAADWDRGMLFAVLCMQLSYEELYNFLAENRNALSPDFLNGLLQAAGDMDPEQLDESVISLMGDWGLELGTLQRSQPFLEPFLRFIAPDEATVVQLKAVLGVSAITATGAIRGGNSLSGKGARYTKEYDEVFRDIPISEPIDKTNGKDGWNGALIESYTLFGRAPTPVKAFTDVTVQVLEQLYAIDPDRFRGIAAEPERYPKLLQLFQGGSANKTTKARTFISPKSLQCGLNVETSTNYNDKVAQLRSLVQAMGHEPSELLLRLKLAHRKTPVD